jgi:hypothetical protein
MIILPRCHAIIHDSPRLIVNFDGLDFIENYGKECKNFFCLNPGYDPTKKEYQPRLVEIARKELKNTMR